MYMHLKGHLISHTAAAKESGFTPHDWIGTDQALHATKTEKSTGSGMASCDPIEQPLYQWCTKPAPQF